MRGDIFAFARSNSQLTRYNGGLQARLITGKAKWLCIVRKQRGNECTSTFARYAIGSSAIEDHPSKERAVGDVLLGPGSPQSPAPTALLPAHPGHVEHLAPSVLSLLQPAVPSCKQRKKLECRMLPVWNRWPRRTGLTARIIRDAPSLPFRPPSSVLSDFFSFSFLFFSSFSFARLNTCLTHMWLTAQRTTTKVWIIFRG